MSDKTKEFVQNDNSPEAKLRRYLEMKRRKREEFERNMLHPKTREELQDMIVDAIKEKGPEVNLNYIDVSEIDHMRFLFSTYYGNDINKNQILQSFNGNISDWDVSGVTDMTGMFSGASNFNKDISDWDVSSVENMSFMFHNASSFNQDISDWDVSNVENMNSMFYGAKSFYGDISQWYVSKVKNMSFMFHNASSFNGDISKWDVRGVEDMNSMFSGAKSFYGDISQWDVTGKDTEDMFEYCPIKDEFKPKGL